MSAEQTDPVVVRHYKRDLVGLDPNGRPCEACGRHMHEHEWADLDTLGFVVACVYSSGEAS